MHCKGGGCPEGEVDSGVVCRNFTTRKVSRQTSPLSSISYIIRLLHSIGYRLEPLWMHTLMATAMSWYSRGETLA